MSKVFPILLLWLSVGVSNMAAAKKPAKKSDLNLASKVFRQGDAIIRETWWVVAADRKLPQKTPFGKLMRALQFDMGTKLSRNLGFRCDRYQLKKSADKRPMRVEVFETCSSRGPSLIADFQFEKANRIQVTFYPEHLADILGLQASVLNKRANCDLSFKDNGQVTSLVCQSWTQDRSGQELADLAKIEYQSQAQTILEIKGEILKDLNAIRKIETSVPLTGPITVVETEIPQPVQALPPPVAPPSKGGTAQAPPAKRNQSLPEAEYIPADQPEGTAPVDDSPPNTR